MKGRSRQTPEQQEGFHLRAGRGCSVAQGPVRGRAVPTVVTPLWKHNRVRCCTRQREEGLREVGASSPCPP